MPVSPPPPPQVRIAWDFRTRQTLGAFTVDGKPFAQRHYPRIKRLKNGDLLMTFMDGRYGWQVFEQKSKDGGKTWSAPRWIKKSWRDTAANDTVVYCNPDFLQLKDGTLLLVSQRRNNHRSNENEGIEVMRSTDEGETWSEPIWTFRGKNWEPSLIQLPSGEVQLLFTDTHDGICHVGLVRSLDGGKTWTPAPNVQHEQAEYLSRTESKTADGKPFSMDGMAVGVCLQNGKGIVYACECDQVHHVLTPVPVTPSIVWSSLAADWRDPNFTSPMPGPADRRWAVQSGFLGFAPYLIQLDSGEVIVQSNGRRDGVGGTWTFIGDDTAHGFTAASRPFGSAGFWGCIAQIAPDRVLSGTTSGPQGSERILLTEGILDRPLQVSDSNGDSTGNAWFIGDQSQAQGTLSAEADSTALTLHFLARDDSVVADVPETSDGFRLSWQSGSGGTLYRITATAGGSGWLESRPDTAGATWTRVADAVPIVRAGRSTEGYQINVTVPWTSLGGQPASGATAVAHLELLNVDAPGQARTVDGVPGEDPEAPKTWLSVRLPSFASH